MKKLFVIATVTLLTGCSTVQNWIPSFWDDNQSAKIIDVRQQVYNIDCTKPQLPQAQGIANGLQWFRLYSDSKGMLQKDVLRITAPIEETAVEWVKRSETQEGSKVYCEMKKKVLVKQIDRAASGILGRW
jgi:flagellar basal body L-ring protein FlgH